MQISPRVCEMTGVIMLPTSSFPSPKSFCPQRSTSLCSLSELSCFLVLSLHSGSSPSPHSQNQCVTTQRPPAIHLASPGNCISPPSPAQEMLWSLSRKSGCAICSCPGVPSGSSPAHGPSSLPTASLSLSPKLCLGMFLSTPACLFRSSLLQGLFSEPRWPAGDPQ